MIFPEKKIFPLDCCKGRFEKGNIFEINHGTRKIIHAPFYVTLNLLLHLTLALLPPSLRDEHREIAILHLQLFDLCVEPALNLLP